MNTISKAEIDKTFQPHEQEMGTVAFKAEMEHKAIEKANTQAKKLAKKETKYKDKKQINKQFQDATEL